MAAYLRHDTSFFSQRAIFLVAIVCLHILAFYLFESGLASRIIKTVAPPLQTDIVQEVKQHDVPPPPPPPKMERPPVEVPPPDIQINLPAQPSTTAITNVTTKHVAAPPPAPARRADVRTSASEDRRHSPSTDDYYPDISRRLQETGTSHVHVCWGADGRIKGKPTVEKSAGSSRLDAAAVDWATHLRMTPGTLNGKPEEGCGTMPVTFKLTGD